MPLPNGISENIAPTAAKNLVTLRVIVVSLSWLTYAVAVSHAQMQLELFYIMSAILLVHTIAEITLLPNNNFLSRFINPLSLALTGNSLLVYGGITNFFIFYQDYGNFDFSYIAPSLTPDRWYAHFCIALATTCAVLASTSYYWKTGQSACDYYQDLLPTANLLRGPVNAKVLVFYVIAAIVFRMVLFRIGLHGRMVSPEFFDAQRGFLPGSEIRRFAPFCTLALVLSFIVHARQPSATTGLLRWTIFFSEVLFGFLYGARSAIVMPIAVLVVTDFYTKRRFHFRFPLLSVLALVVAMTIGNEFKHYAEVVGYRSGMGVIDVLLDFGRRRSQFTKTHGSKSFGSSLEYSARNFNKVPETSAAIQYANESSDNYFHSNGVKELLTAPVHSIMPRSISGISPTPWGLAFKNRVLRRNIEASYSIAFSPIGFLYFVGGSLMVLLGALTLGIMLRFAESILHMGDLGFLLYLGLMSQLYIVNTVASETILNTSRYLIFMPPLFGLLFRKP